MASQRPGLAASRAGQRALHALTRRVLPGQLGHVVDAVVKTKLAIAVLPAAVIVLLLVVAIVGVLGAIGGGDSYATTCGTTAAPVSLSGPPANLIPLYQAAAAQSGLDPYGPAVLAGINRVETDFGQDVSTSSAGAIGFMQFEPGTWKEYGDGGDPYNPHDAIFAAARLLKASGAPQNWNQAIFAYNHADWYVQEVLKYANQYASQVSSTGGASSPTMTQPISLTACTVSTGPTVPGDAAKLNADGLVSAPADAPAAVQAMITAGNRIAALPYVWGGHHAPGSPTNGYDCSSAVSYVLYAAGLLPAGSAGFTAGQFWTGYLAADFSDAGPVPGLQPGPGKWVTIYSNADHVFMVIAGVRFDDSADYLRNGKGPNGTNVSMWQPPFKTVTGFAASHPNGL